MTSNTKPMRQQVEEYIVDLQEKIVVALEELDPTAPKFKRDSWVRTQGGLGKSCVFAAPPSSSFASSEDATIPAHNLPQTVLEKAGVNISVVHGILPPPAIRQMRADHNSMALPDRPEGLPFFAAGISLVIHPRNPHAPTVHANYRYFEITEPTSGSSPGDSPASQTQGKVLAWWFGGGSDLTPSYLYPEDCEHFHGTLKSACAQHSPSLYPEFKKWCDEYFFIPHRNETRGIGGIFFDDLNSGPHFRLTGEKENGKASPDRPSTPESIFAFIQSLGNSFVESYVPIVQRRIGTPYSPTQRRWQLLRRGRYVEFNLVYDRGTKFGLMTPGARIESILMSLPEEARWEYMSDMGGEGTEEGKLMEVLRTPKEWV
ncbi:hypothetical protein CVT24_002488 [Panaeolus cyanescens]|uniref:coproporphyrinogen oxidase n=1 Tax=Panaeolus cyanescens TaxID=181874 RepID=A0A409YTN8_9AGAR|nr:hypothetical protein CVT24_002488 [Panaeolus cyanescens]